eukprot:TRINITY_DN11390_c0_g1_i1.p1 TRINITY_DN11390_c0_g1~~TRINITY_DN11390_c0_g1_i1.p1  ORF type:complete len:172 (-),score=18.82 TRINITY_DN11390_c0_g1_i1:427-942(-)
MIPLKGPDDRRWNSRMCSHVADYQHWHTSVAMRAVAASFGAPGHDSSRPSLESPWDRLDYEEQVMVEAYCAEIEKTLAESADSFAFLERGGGVDQRHIDAWLTHELGSAQADPMQVFRQPPTGGVVQSAASARFGVSSPASALGQRSVEILQRHAAFLEHRQPSNRCGSLR